ncbi:MULTISPECIES: hypothetical protein [Pseudomonas]|uniref:hypothetical protein n=1 Tax=Pseudomonas TaxID=286 RepID=UPI000BA482B3|nr:MULTISPECIES: hypothetical protein [Pseudomonas]MDR9864493.1 hypothetical protein [Pseudomonas baetica]
MKAKGVWGFAIAGLVGIAGLIGAPIADSLVKEGKLPDWISPKLVEFVAWLSADVPVPVWLLVLILVGIVGAACLFIRFQSVVTRKQSASISEMGIDLDSFKQRCIELGNRNVDLVRQVDILTEEIETKSAALGLSDRTVLVFLASLENKRVPATMEALLDTGLDRLVINAGLDKLIERQFVKKHLAYSAWIYHLTPAGRVYYLEHVRAELTVS